jgi:hypothetical protein
MNNYRFKFVWFNVTANTKIKLILLSIIAILLYYGISCLTLYAFVQLTGFLSFSWINGLWTFILLAVAYITFGAK